MKYPNLRTTLCLLLIALWVRSYSRLDVIQFRQHSISSLEGKVGIDERVTAISARSSHGVSGSYFGGQVMVTSRDADKARLRHNSGTIIHYAYLLDALIGTTVLGLIIRAAKYLKPTT